MSDSRNEVAAAPVLGATGKTKIMIIGDSVTHGSDGDFTWRYRLYKSLKRVEFVGPHTGLKSLKVTEDYDTNYYANHNFDKSHAARWGMNLNFPEIPWTTLMTTYTPDVVVCYLGFNDTFWLLQSAQQMATAWGAFITALRSVNPNVKIVLGRLPQTWVAGINEFNDMMPSVAKQYSTAESPVVITRKPVFDKDKDTWDTVHPSTTGEVKIAKAVARALEKLGVCVADNWPAKARNKPLNTSTINSMSVASRNITMNYTYGVGVQACYVWFKLGGGSWTQFMMGTDPNLSSMVMNSMSPGSYQFKLQSYKGTMVDNGYGNIYSIVVT